MLQTRGQSAAICLQCGEKKAVYIQYVYAAAHCSEAQQLADHTECSFHAGCKYPIPVVQGSHECIACMANPAAGVQGAIPQVAVIQQLWRLGFKWDIMKARSPADVQKILNRTLRCVKRLQVSIWHTRLHCAAPRSISTVLVIGDDAWGTCYVLSTVCVS
jgi:hypothetical protein